MLITLSLTQTPIEGQARRDLLDKGVEWIALNDESGDRNIESVAGFISTILLADLLDKTPRQVARRVVNYRRLHKI